MTKKSTQAILPSSDAVTKARSILGRVNNAIWMEKTTHEWRVANAKRARALCKRNPVKPVKP